MATLQNLHRIMTERRDVQLTDGRVGRVVRVDTVYPANATTVTVWTELPDEDAPASSKPGVARVALSDIVGEVARQSA
ncbi:MAG TPA: hypothetical protein VEQ58_18235 [Polyangiaceae bacterium]|nr:hypothetical protein [Polyangiaceae bacterium]